MYPMIAARKLMNKTITTKTPKSCIESCNMISKLVLSNKKLILDLNVFIYLLQMPKYQYYFGDQNISLFNYTNYVLNYEPDLYHIALFIFNNNKNYNKYTWDFNF